MKFSVKLTRAILSHQKPFPDSSGTSMSSKTPGRLDIRNPVKTPSILQVSWGSWIIWKWFLVTQNSPRKYHWKFHKDWTSGTLSRLHLSSKSLPGVLEDMEVPDESGNGFWWLRIPLESITENFIKIGHQEPCQNSTYPPNLFLESWRTWRFLTNLKMVPGDSE